MRFKLIVVFIDEAKTDAVMDAARLSGATGSTVINHARGEGLKKRRTFMGLTMEVQRDVILLLVEEHLSRQILEKISEVGEFDDHPGSGIALLIDVEDAVGVAHQVAELSKYVEEEI